MLSRTAEALYLLSRLLERAEHGCRVLDVHLNLSLYEPEILDAERWRRTLVSLSGGAEQEMSRPAAFAVDLIGRARECARQSREQISSEMWQEIQRLSSQVQRLAAESAEQAYPSELLSVVRAGVQRFQGITDSTVAHGEGWLFIQAGRYLERTLLLAALLDAQFSHLRDGASAGDTNRGRMEWGGLLRACTAYEAFSKTHGALPSPEHVIAFLLLGAAFPHSIRFSVDRLHEALEALPEIGASLKGGRVSRLASRLRASLSFMHAAEVLHDGVAPLAQTIRRQCQQIDNAIVQGYFRYSNEGARLSGELVS